MSDIPTGPPLFTQAHPPFALPISSQEKEISILCNAPGYDPGRTVIARQEDELDVYQRSTGTWKDGSYQACWFLG